MIPTGAKNTRARKRSLTYSHEGLRAIAFEIGSSAKSNKNRKILRESIIRLSFSHVRGDIGETIRFDVVIEKVKSSLTSTSTRTSP
jgi:hypothetical protein